MLTPKPWKLLKSVDVSPSPHFPIEKRTYELPNGKIVDDFYVTTLEDSAYIIPVTTEGKLVLIRMYKPGLDQVVVQFPAGRIEAKKHKSPRDAAAQELLEEAGIRIDESLLIPLGKLAAMTTKATEVTHVFVAPNVTINAQQKLDETEEIEVFTATRAEVDEMIRRGEAIEAQMIAAWYLFTSINPSAQ